VFFRIAEDFESHSSKALKDPDYYIGNPINAYLFVKHFTLDWDRDIDQELRNNSREGGFILLRDYSLRVLYLY